MTEILKLTQPAAYIAVNKNVIKNYDGKLYMADNQEFMIYLVNPTTYSYLAKIKLNGNYISSTGLVLRPGEKTWLDCNWDDNRKFAFRTYTVDDTPETKMAIANNGDVEVEFYKEEVKIPHYKPDPWVVPYYPPYLPTTPWINPCTPPYNPMPPFVGPNIFYCCDANIKMGDVSSETTTASGFIDQDQNKYNPFKDFLKGSSKSKEVETGRIEKGGISDQKFTTVDIDFDSWYTCISKYKIYPLSERKTITTKEIRVYCSCGKRLKKSDKFCSACGKVTTNV